MKHWDIQLINQRLLDLETMGRRYILEIDPSEGRRNTHDGFDELLRTLGIDLDIENIDVREMLEQHTFTFHDRLAGKGSDVTQPQHRRTIGDYADEITFGGLVISILRIICDSAYRLGDTGRVGERGITLSAGRL